MKNIVTLGLGVLAMVSVSLAQQDPQFSQNMHNRLYPNPGVAGSNNAICGTLFGRHQWMGFNGKPETYMLSVHAPIPNLPVSAGAGLTVFSDQLGQESTFGLKVAGAYRMSLGTGNLGIGIGLGFLRKTLGASWVSIDPYEQDPAINNASIAKTVFDMDLGVYYKTEELYVGISALHLPAATVKESVSGSDPYNFNYQIARHYYIMAGYKYQISGTDFAVEPSIFIKTDASSTQMDINVIAWYQNMIWAGASYRLADAIAPMLGVQKQLGPGTAKVGYSYDVTTSLLRKHSSGSHELMLGYCFNLPDDNAGRGHRSVRFMD